MRTRGQSGPCVPEVSSSPSPSGGDRLGPRPRGSDSTDGAHRCLGPRLSYCRYRFSRNGPRSTTPKYKQMSDLEGFLDSHTRSPTRTGNYRRGWGRGPCGDPVQRTGGNVDPYGHIGGQRHPRPSDRDTRTETLGLVQWPERVPRRRRGRHFTLVVQGGTDGGTGPDSVDILPKFLVWTLTDPVSNCEWTVDELCRG